MTGKVGVKQLSGPVGIVNMVDTTYNESKSYGVFIVIAQFLNIGILLSANLGVMNLLPLPALDGGRLVFLLIEQSVENGFHRRKKATCIWQAWHF